MKTGIITGASSGLGREFVKQCRSEFPEIEEFWLIARREEKIKENIKEVTYVCNICPSGRGSFLFRLSPLSFRTPI